MGDIMRLTGIVLLKHLPAWCERREKVTVNRSCRKTSQNVFRVINTLAFSTLIRLIAIALAALLLVNYAKFTPEEVIRLVQTIIS